MNKASGGDGIPVELFQILKDDVVKVLQSICQQIWKTQQWPQDWKRSVFIWIPKKGNAKECSNYGTIVLISHASRRRQWHPTPVLLPGKSYGRRSLVGCSPWGHQESDVTERLHFHFSLSCIVEGNGNPLQCSCLENPRDGGAWWATVYGVAQSQTRLSHFIFTSHFHALEKEMATHSSVLAWRILGTGDSGLPSMGSQSRTRRKQLSSSRNSAKKCH